MKWMKIVGPFLCAQTIAIDAYLSHARKNTRRGIKSKSVESTMQKLVHRWQLRKCPDREKIQIWELTNSCKVATWGPNIYTHTSECKNGQTNMFGQCSCKVAPWGANIYTNTSKCKLGQKIKQIWTSEKNIKWHATRVSVAHDAHPEPHSQERIRNSNMQNKFYHIVHMHSHLTMTQWPLPVVVVITSQKTETKP